MIEAKDVEAIVRYCLYKDGEETSNAKMVQGITVEFGFHPDRLAEKKADIDRMLLELPTEFRKTEGGGWSFVQACETKDGDLWGQHRDIEMLMCLGIAVGSVEYLMPREMWGVLPGGVPYFQILIEGPKAIDFDGDRGAGWSAPRAVCQ